MCDAWRDVPEALWNDWHWQQAHRIRTLLALERVVHLTDDERRAVTEAAALFRMAITPYYASLIDPDDVLDPIRQQAVPQLAELVVQPDEMVDPLAEESHMPVEGLTHRYPDRVLLYVTHNCPVYCRHCNRKRKVGNPQSAPARDRLDAWIDYLRTHDEVRDVLVSGGDPLSLSDARLEEILRRLREVPHIEILRLATRNPVTLPQRLTDELVAMLRRYQPLYVNTHFNHLRECTPEAARALDRLADGGSVLGNQMVLLRGINEDPNMVRALNHWLLRHRCRPYYIFQADPAQGIAHFRTPIASGLRLIDSLRGWTSGLAVPHYVVDLPGGGGKVPLVPEYHVAQDGRRYTFRNYAGELFTYDEGVTPTAAPPTTPSPAPRTPPRSGRGPRRGRTPHETS
ncbi:MAG: KamA family radical SAM protein [Myxococcota bacterium]